MTKEQKLEKHIAERVDSLDWQGDVKKVFRGMNKAEITLEDILIAIDKEMINEVKVNQVKYI